MALLLLPRRPDPLRYTWAHPLNPSKPQPFLPPSLPPKLNDRWEKLDQRRPSSRKPSPLKCGALPTLYQRATAQGLLGPRMCEFRWRRGCELLATMASETREREKRARGLGLGWVGGVMDSLAEDPTGGAGIGCPGHKRETGDWLLQ